MDLHSPLAGSRDKPQGAPHVDCHPDPGPILHASVQGHADRRQMGRERLGRAHHRRESRQARADRRGAARQGGRRRARGRGGREGLADWRKVVPRERGKMLLKIAEAMEARVEELARTIALETGNALRTQARGEAKMAADIFRYFGGLASELKGETVPLGEHVLSYTRREPLGVVGAIIPWNAPVMLGALKIAPALCAGNTMVMKAAEDAPLGVLLMADICQEFVPPGVLNVLTGYGEECGGPLANHPGSPSSPSPARPRSAR